MSESAWILIAISGFAGGLLAPVIVKAIKGFKK